MYMRATLLVSSPHHHAYSFRLEVHRMVLWIVEDTDKSFTIQL